MDDKTKVQALKKLKSMNVNVAYPNELLNNTILEKYYEKLHLNETHFLESALNIDNFGKNLICSRYHEPVNRSEWSDHASSIYVNANYNGKGNAIRKF
jgi:predicted metalloendopeptidase